jgi:hypothetical protein
MTSSFDVLLYALAILPPPLFVYASYWALSIRRNLGVPVYRKQALGIGLVGISFAWIFASQYYGISNALPVPVRVYTLALTAAMAFYYIDASVLAARRSDPLLRNTLFWGRLRIILWTVIIIAIGFVTVLFAFLYATGTPPSDSVNPPLPELLLIISPVFIAGVSGVIFLPFAARRSKDMTLRRHLIWLGLSVFLSLGLGGPFFPAPFPFLFDIAAGYCLYRSARSLVPLNRLSLEELGAEPKVS